VRILGFDGKHSPEILLLLLFIAIIL